VSLWRGANGYDITTIIARLIYDYRQAFASIYWNPWAIVAGSGALVPEKSALANGASTDGGNPAKGCNSSLE
jgi:hypothetical protein